MHRIVFTLSIIGISFYVLASAQSAQAQIDLDLLLNTPTPSPLPPGQEYILELEQLDVGAASDSGHLGSFTVSEQQRFEENGYIVRSTRQDIFFSIDRTQIAFSSFETAPVQEEKSVATISSEESGFQVLMNAHTGLSSVNGTTIPTTRCDSHQTCSPLRAESWKKQQPPGWGYNLSGSRIPKDFQDKTFYRSPSLDGSISLLKQGEATKTNTITVTWKVITDGLNDEKYSPIVRLFALPY